MSIIHLPYTHDCFVCGANNEHGLQLRFRVEEGEIRADLQAADRHSGYRGVVHGGVIASALDEAMFWSVAHAKRAFYVSVEIQVRYLQKVGVGGRYRVTARLVREQKRICFTEAEWRTEAGVVCAKATGKFFPLRPTEVPLSHEDFCIDPGTLSVAEFFPSNALESGQGIGQ